LGEPIGEGLEGHGWNGEDRDESRWFGAQPDGPVTAAGFVNGFWAGADWVLRKRWDSEDWEWCPTEPGTFPLVAGATNRVLKLRGYGDAICAEVAKAFIEASTKETA
jgi:DNA (cytosine-5)-methyltransferase 1